jgi:hypothetical protein
MQRTTIDRGRFDLYRILSAADADAPYRPHSACDAAAAAAVGTDARTLLYTRRYDDVRSHHLTRRDRDFVSRSGDSCVYSDDCVARVMLSLRIHSMLMMVEEIIIFR